MLEARRYLVGGWRALGGRLLAFAGARGISIGWPVGGLEFDSGPGRLTLGFDVVSFLGLNTGPV